MNLEFSRQKLAENIMALIQQKKLRIGEVEQQIGIARQKAGIGPDEKGVSLERFEVIRHGDKG